jgi:hypothetical protein
MLAHSISSAVFSPSGPSADSTLSADLNRGRHPDDPVICVDNVLPPRMLQHMQSALGPDAPFWREHAYDSPQTGFFSYQHALPDFASTSSTLSASPSPSSSSSPAGSLHDVILHIWHQAALAYPPLQRATFAEWWAHSRPHCNGHTLHYDYVVQPQQEQKADDGFVSSGKAKTKTGKKGKAQSPKLVPIHPIMSTVTFVTADCGGPTLVRMSNYVFNITMSSIHQNLISQITDQTMDAAQTTKGWLVAPQLNRTIGFAGSQLHCVLPGAGYAPSADARRLTFSK